MSRTRYCLTCNKEFIRNPRESWKVFNNKKYCSFKCFSRRILSEEYKQKLREQGRKIFAKLRSDTKWRKN